MHEMTPSVLSVLIVEDDAGMRDALCMSLESLGYSTAVAADAPRAFDAIGASRFDLVLLDLELPGGDGLDILRTLRGRESTNTTPVLIMTGGRTQPADIVNGLNLGADDYLKKPFEFAELAARIRAVRRRAEGGSVALFQIADLEVDRTTRQVRRAGRVVDLTQKEFALLELLAKNEDRIVSRDQIAEQVWKESAGATTLDNIINVHISHLRQKIDADFEPKLLHTLRGRGFCLSTRDNLL